MSIKGKAGHPPKRAWLYTAAAVALMVMSACLGEDRDLSADEALEAVAVRLCPEAPESVKRALVAGYDSEIYDVWVRSSSKIKDVNDIRDPTRDALAAFFVAKDLLEPGIVVEPMDVESERFLHETREACASGTPPLLE